MSNKTKRIVILTELELRKTLSRLTCEIIEKVKNLDNLLLVGKVYPFFLLLNKTFLAEEIKFFINPLHFQQLVHLLNIFQNKQK